MTHYYIELLIWLSVAYLIGCVIGAVARKWLGKAPEEVQEVPAVVMAASDGEAPEPAPGYAPMAPRIHAATASEETVEAAAFPSTGESAAEEQEPEPVSRKIRMPVGIAGPRAGRPDELQRISGVGQRNEQILHSLGFYHFDQIAQWTDEQVEWVDGYLRFNGRIRRENWVEQCRLLAAGEEEEFMRLYGTGGLMDATGIARSGENTRH